MKCIQIASLFANYFEQSFIWEARGEKILFHGVSVILFETASYNKAASSGKVCLQMVSWSQISFTHEYSIASKG